MDNVRLAELLNDLLEYLHDSHMGYQESLSAIHDEKMMQVFNSLSLKRQNMAQELAEKIKFLGATPKGEGSVAGAAHRLFVNLKGMITGGDVDAIINEIKRGENTMIERYKEVLRQDIPEGINALLTKYLDGFEKDLAAIDKLSVISNSNNLPPVM